MAHTGTGYDSPTGIDAPLEYITVESYAWPKPEPVKRPRLDERERRRRHNECQKRFLKRKQREFEQLHQQVARLELQLKLAAALRETKELQAQQTQLTQQVVSTRTQKDLVEPKMLRHDESAEPHVEALVVPLLDVDELLTVDALVSELGLPWL